MNPKQIQEYFESFASQLHGFPSATFHAKPDCCAHVDSDGDRRMGMGVSMVSVNDGRFKAIEAKQEQLLKALATQAFYIQNLQEALEKGVSLNTDEVQRLHNLETMAHDTAQRQGLQEAQWQTLADETMKDLTLLRLSLLGVYEDVQKRNQVLENDLTADLEQINNALAGVIYENAKASTSAFEKVAQDLASADNKISDLQSLVKEIAVDQRSLVNRVEALEKKREADKTLIDAVVGAFSDVAEGVHQLVERQAKSEMTENFLSDLVSRNADHVVHFMTKMEEREQKLISRIEDLEAKIQSMQGDRLLDSLSSALS